MTTWLHEQRLEAVHRIVRKSGASAVLDLGCGDGDLLVRLASEPQLRRIVGLDTCRASLGRLRARLRSMNERATAHVDLVLGSMTERHPPLIGFECAILIETVEHIEPGRLAALEQAVFAYLRPKTVVVTTPNAEFNPLLGVPSHRFRHPDHRFEWDRTKFRHWAGRVATRNGYTVACRDIAGCHPDYGGASQMAEFRSAAGSRDHRARHETLDEAEAKGQR